MGNSILIGITINSLKKLNSNDYQNMIIKKYNYGYSINIKKDKNLPLKYEMVSKRFKTLNDNPDQRLIEVIEFFLENHTIKELKMERIDYHYGFFLSVIGNNSKMSLQIPKKINNVDLSTMIFSRYKMDRDKFLYENFDVKEYYIYDSSSSSSYCLNNNGSVSLNLSLGNDFDFLIKFIDGKIKKCDKYIYDHFYYRGINSEIGCFSLFLDDVKFDINMNSIDKYNFLDEVRGLINDRNEEILNSKKMQLKMEGF